MNPTPPLNWLRTFACAAQHKNFTRAAQELNLTQAAVSKQMRSLEQALNQPLFNRQAHGITLTELGERYLVEVQAALQALDGATSDLFGLRQRGVVQLRVNISFSHWLLMPKLAALYQALPELEMEMTHTVWDVNREAIGGDIDIRYGLAPWKGCSALRLTQDQLVPVVASRCTNVDQLPLIHVLGYRQGWQWYEEQSHIKLFKSRAQRSVDNSIIAYQMAAQGLGIALARSSFMRHDWAQKHLRALPLPWCETQEAFYALCSSEQTLNPASAKLWHWLSKEFK